MNSYARLVNEYRGDTLDLIRFGHLVIVNERGDAVFSLGEPDTPVFCRSASKPIQALPVIARGLDKRYGITDEESAIFAASHMGEEFHVRALESIFKKTGFAEDMLIMKPCAPASSAANEARLRANLPVRKFYHNCSGKHAALLIAQRALGGAPEDYWKLGSVVQVEVERTVKALSETDETAIGVDGCGVPVFAVPLKHIAIAYKNLACIDTIKDGALQEAAAAFIPRMHKYPHMISGTNKLCTILNSDENLVAKFGANGVYGLGLKKQRLGVAIKVLDGSIHALPLLLLEALKALNALAPETEERLLSLRPYVVLNDNDLEVGRSEAAFKIAL